MLAFARGNHETDGELPVIGAAIVAEFFAIVRAQFGAQGVKRG